jgi:hypothetical protein
LDPRLENGGGKGGRGGGKREGRGKKGKGRRKILISGFPSRNNENNVPTVKCVTVTNNIFESI